ncbi:single-stranded DNA-binding protein [Nocardiopsis coralliicola]
MHTRPDAPARPVPEPPEAAPSPAEDAPHCRNEVLLAGRVTAEPSLRELASGERLVTWRVSISRPPTPRRPAGGSDAVACLSFSPEIAEATRAWRLGDVVEVAGALRRRFRRSRGLSGGVLEVEAVGVRRLQPGDP